MTEIAQTFPPETQAWNMETGAGANKTTATLGEIMTALDDPQFRATTANSPGVNAAIRDMRTAGTTEAELFRFDEQLRTVPGGIAAFEGALYRVAPHLAPSEEPSLGGSR